jgi:hypothetical protein
MSIVVVLPTPVRIPVPIDLRGLATVYVINPDLRISAHFRLIQCGFWQVA